MGVMTSWSVRETESRKKMDKSGGRGNRQHPVVTERVAGYWALARVWREYRTNKQKRRKACEGASGFRSGAASH